eukprot:403356953
MINHMSLNKESCDYEIDFIDEKTLYDKFMQSSDKMTLIFNTKLSLSPEKQHRNEPSIQSQNIQQPASYKCKSSPINNQNKSGVKQCKIKEIEDLLKKLREPMEPGPDDCCGSGCSPCVFDTYYDKLGIYQEKKEELESKLIEYEEDDDI